MEQPTWLIAGLGNPGRRFAGTRHNIGFMVVESLARQLGDGPSRHRFDAEILEISGPNGRIVLVKPQTFMNRSGNAVTSAARWYRVPAERLLVVYDDVDLPFGQIRLRPKGSSGGHNGIASVIERLGTDRIPRLRVGVGRPAHYNAVSYVLSRFTKDQEADLTGITDRATEAVLTWQREGIQVAMNIFNRRHDEVTDKGGRHVDPAR